MATPVPYVGAPEVSPQLGALPSAHVDTPTAAFGGAVAGAITHAGEIAEGAGKELFARAYAMQEMDQLNKSDAAAMDTINKQADAFTDLTKLKGQDLVDAQQGYRQRLADIRQQGAASLDSPLARQNYNRQTFPNESRMVWHGAVAAREGANQSMLAVAQSKMDTIGDNLAKVGQVDGPGFDEGIAHIRDAATEYLRIRQGLHPGQDGFDDALRDLVSVQAAKAINSYSRAHPAEGPGIMQKYIGSGLLLERDADKLDWGVNNRAMYQGASQIAKLASSGSPDLYASKTYTPALSEWGVKAGSESGSWSATGPKRADGTYGVGRYGISSALLPKLLPTAGLTNESGGAVTTEADFLNSPKAQRDLYAKEWPTIQAKNKTFKDALTEWSGVDSRANLSHATAAIARNAPPSMVQSAAEDEANRRAPKTPYVSDNAGQLAVSQQSTVKRKDDLTSKQDYLDIMGAISGVGSADGKVPTSWEEASQDPKFAKAYDLPPDMQDKIKDRLKENAKLGGRIPNPAGNLIYTRMKSIALGYTDHSSTPDELDELAALKPLNTSMTNAQALEIMKLQHGVVADEMKNPPVEYAMKLSETQRLMASAGISKTSSPDEYAKFHSALNDALVDAGIGMGRPLHVAKDDEQINYIVKKLIDEQAIGWFHNSPMVYNDPIAVSEKSKVQARKLFRAKFGRDPDLEENGQDYQNASHLLFEEIFRKVGESAGKSTSRTQP